MDVAPAPVVLLLTACVAPAKHPDLVRDDPEVRLADYASSLARWMDHQAPHLRGVVFVENSGFPLDRLAEAFSSIDRAVPLEFTGFRATPTPPGIHYGYGELQAIDWALTHSSLLQSPDRMFAKATGRLYFPDFGTLLSRIDARMDAVVDTRWGLGAILRGERPSRTVSTQLMLFRTGFYRDRLRGRESWLQPVPGRAHIEHFFQAQLFPLRHDPRVQLSFPVAVPPSGVGGGGKDYSTSRRRAIERLRTQANRMFIG